MTFKETLAGHNITEDKLSHSIKVKIKKYTNLEASISEAVASLIGITNDRARQKVEQQITEGNEMLTQLNSEIITSIDKFVANFDLNQKRAAGLQKARESRGKGKPSADNQGQQQEPDQGQQQHQQSQGGSNDDNNTSNTPDPVVVTEKKKSSILGWILGGIAVAALGYFGIKHMNKD